MAFYCLCLYLLTVFLIIVLETSSYAFEENRMEQETLLFNSWSIFRDTFFLDLTPNNSLVHHLEYTGGVGREVKVEWSLFSSLSILYPKSLFHNKKMLTLSGLLICLVFLWQHFHCFKECGFLDLPITKTCHFSVPALFLYMNTVICCFDNFSLIHFYFLNFRVFYSTSLKKGQFLTHKNVFIHIFFIDFQPVAYEPFTHYSFVHFLQVAIHFSNDNVMKYL